MTTSKRKKEGPESFRPDLDKCRCKVWEARQRIWRKGRKSNILRL